jgi:hypothetical protein
MSNAAFFARALQLAERIDLKGLERPEQFSSNPLAFKAGSGGTVVLFRFGAGYSSASIRLRRKVSLKTLPGG